ncbi:MAG: alpha/beta hydrolase [Candidatus Edwardsbacteria bacterium]|jgi:hypothetical protein|nr:alpha/beta hydrolase [Candidatus Edwardsbacteria bacterium]
MMRLLLRTAAALAAGYALLALFALLFADSMIFYPHRAELPAGAAAIGLRGADGTAISAVHLRNDGARFTVLYSYGNGDDLAGALPLLEDLRRAGFAVFAYDYPGYGASGGRPSEQGVYRAVEAAYDHLTTVERLPPGRIIAFGRSLGGAAAVDLAARRPVAALVMESSFVTAFRVMTGAPLLPFDKFRNIEKVGRVHCPVLFVHGTADRTIPDWHGRALFHAANQPKRLVLVENGGHNDLCQVAGTRYLQIVRDFADSLP